MLAKDNQVSEVKARSFSLYGKMPESGFTEIIPLIHTSAIWGRSPDFSSWVSTGYIIGGAVVGRRRGAAAALAEGLTAICLHSEFTPGSLCKVAVVAWGLQHPLITDVAGNIFSLLRGAVRLKLWSRGVLIGIADPGSSFLLHHLYGL